MAFLGGSLFGIINFSKYLSKWLQKIHWLIASMRRETDGHKFVAQRAKNKSTPAMTDEVAKVER